MSSFDFALLCVSALSAGVAAIAGFGIGSLLTPVFSLAVDTKLAVALVSIPHLTATALRFWMMKAHVDRKVLLHFGLMSAIGGLCGALVQSRFQPAALTLIFGFILMFAGFTGATGIAERMRFSGRGAWFAGCVSGFLGGLVGNQGGIRSAAMMGFQVTKESFVATATATGLIVDAARMPVYFWNNGPDIATHGRWMVLAVLGVTIGTLIGGKILKHLPERVFRRVVSSLIFILGLAMIYKGLV